MRLLPAGVPVNVEVIKQDLYRQPAADVARLLYTTTAATLAH